MHTNSLYIIFYRLSKGFRLVDHKILWVTLSDMGTPTPLIVLLKNLCIDQEAIVRTEFGETDVSNCQGNATRMHYFSTFAEAIMQEALENWERGIKVSGKKITNLRYADDNYAIGEHENEIKTILDINKTMGSVGKK